MSEFMKHSICNQSGLELLTRLRNSRASLMNVVDEAPVTPAYKLATMDQFDRLITTLESEQVETPSEPLSFSAANDETLTKFNIVNKGMLFLRPEVTLREAITTSRTAGSDKLWSNDNMYKHLAALLNSVTNMNKISSRMIVDTFFLRSTAMVPSPRKAIVMVDNQVSDARPSLSHIDTFEGVIDYTAIVAGPGRADVYLEVPPTMTQREGRRMLAFLASVPKPKPIRVPAHIDDDLPRAVLELVSCARLLGETHIRGALTTGFEWRFIAVDLNVDGDGAKYWISQLIQWRWEINRDQPVRERFIKETSDESDPALIAAILSSWITASFEEYKDINDPWFVSR